MTLLQAAIPDDGVLSRFFRGLVVCFDLRPVGWRRGLALRLLALTLARAARRFILRAVLAELRVVK